MPKEFINPNLHVILIHYPLGLLVVGTLIEFFSFLGWRRSAFRAAGRWMLLIGILSLTPTLFSGLYALADVNRTTPMNSDDLTWAQVREASPVQREAWDFLTKHAWSNAIGSVVLLITAVLWMGSSDDWRRKLHFVWLLLLIAGLGTLVYGAWFGGEMIYRHGVGVEPVSESASGTSAPGQGEFSPAAAEQTENMQGKIAYYVPPLQTHTILAGAAVSLALAALGVSLRAGARGDRPADYSVELPAVQSGIASALNPSFSRAGDPDEYEPDFDGPRRAPRPRPAAGRFWLIAAVLAIGTSVTGLWTLAYFSDVWNIKELWGIIVDGPILQNRRLAHTITGGGVIALLLLLSVIARITAGRRFVVLLFTMLLVVAVIAQVWFGSLLMFDTPAGRIGSFNVSEPALTNVTPAAEAKTLVPATTPATTKTTTAPAPVP
ncbi:MAG: hypothetical protein QOF78_3466 [Phycisphaerales bacterium]|nr:hypothetical protein [Phycisphaerales bacterium]